MTLPGAEKFSARPSAEGLVSRVLVAMGAADNMLLTTVELGLIPAQRECSFPGDRSQALSESIL
jgi:hypothetical protein